MLPAASLTRNRKARCVFSPLPSSFISLHFGSACCLWGFSPPLHTFVCGFLSLGISVPSSYSLSPLPSLGMHSIINTLSPSLCFTPTLLHRPPTLLRTLSHSLTLTSPHPDIRVLFAIRCLCFGCIFPFLTLSLSLSSHAVSLLSPYYSLFLFRTSNQIMSMPPRLQQQQLSARDIGVSECPRSSR